MKLYGILAGLVLLGMIVGGCSDDKSSPTTPPSEPGQLELVDIGTLIEQSAPPEYTTPVGAPSAIDSAWLYGEYPLPGKVFGSDDPQTLYANVNSFRRSIDVVQNTAQVNEGGSLIPGTYVDSVLVEMDGSEIMMHFTAVVTALDGPTAIPAAAQSVIGTSVNLDYLITVDAAEVTGESIQLGITINDSEQTVLQFDAGMGDPTNNESRLIYATLNPTDSAYVFKGVGYVMHADSEQFNYAFDISSEASSAFAYRMAYFANGIPGTTSRMAIVGGGNRDTEFALKYRQFTPADTTMCDSMWMFDQVFGPNYSEGTGLVSDYDEYLSDELIFSNEALPTEMLPSPWTE
jgi:hypothetical protein